MLATGAILYYMLHTLAIFGFIGALSQALMLKNNLMITLLNIYYTNKLGLLVKRKPLQK
ncbi:hypothetical protein [Psychromonas sp. Urea-02u-13]|uniref:hypothetical protein n=1 Tax=Psychromonas sp. Urea-02u-13 TaxID=2058326 RepID=UPI0012FE86F6|nr:hypothetical protein [Psychromonas sp. Urea-02u-13]